jgi:hypothetical protein
MLLVPLAAGCGAGSAGTAEINPTATTSVGSSVVGPTSSARTTSVTRTPAVATLTVTSTVTTASTPPPPAQTSSPTPVTDLSGEVYGFITAVDPARSELTLDKIDWFTGDGARQACAEDGVTDTSNNWCTGYYWRNQNPALRTVGVDPDAVITVLDGSGSVPGTLADVAGRIATAESTYRMVVHDGQVTELHENYAP